MKFQRGLNKGHGALGSLAFLRNDPELFGESPPSVGVGVEEGGCSLLADASPSSWPAMTILACAACCARSSSLSPPSVRPYKKWCALQKPAGVLFLLASLEAFLLLS